MIGSKGEMYVQAKVNLISMEIMYIKTDLFMHIFLSVFIMFLFKTDSSSLIRFLFERNGHSSFVISGIFLC